MTLIELETVHVLGAEKISGTFTSGFVPLVAEKPEKPSQARDRYALGAMMLPYLLPMMPLISANRGLLDVS